MREQTTIRLTIRPTEEFDKTIREEAQKMGVSMNQMILSALNRWAKSHRVHPRTL